MGLARTMTLKASAAGLDLGGGRDDRRRRRRHAERAARGGARGRRARRRLHHRRGHRAPRPRTWTTSPASRASRSAGGRRRTAAGATFPVTAETVFQAMRRGLAAATGSSDLDGRRVGVSASARSARRWRRSSPRRRPGHRLRPRHGPLPPPRRGLRHLGRAVRRGDPGERARRAGALRGRRLIDEALARSIDCRVVAGAANNPLSDRAWRTAHGARDRLRAGLPRQLRRPDPRLDGVVRQSMAPPRPTSSRARWSGSTRRSRPPRRTAPPIDVAERQALERVEAVCGALARRRRRSSEAGDPARYSRLGLESSFEPVSSRRTFEEAVEQIAERIKSGDLHVGDRLPSERELAAMMRISRPTLREAVKTLVEAGVLEVRRGQSGASSWPPS